MINRTIRRLVAAEASAMVKEAITFGRKIETIPENVTGRLVRRFPGLDEKTAARAARKALRAAQGLKTPRHGTPPSFSFVATRGERELIHSLAPAYGSKSGVIHEALRLLAEAQAGT